MDIVKLILLSVLASITALLTKKFNNECGVLISVICGISVCIFSVAILLPVTRYLKEIIEGSQYQGLALILFKSAGICLLCTFGCEICKDLGEQQLSSRLELAGKCTLIAMSLPIIKTVFDYAQKLAS